MKQSEYLRELKENLESRMKPEELNDILSDYKSFFISGKEEGKTEDEISEELGSPAFLAKALLDEHDGKEVRGHCNTERGGYYGKETGGYTGRESARYYNKDAEEYNGRESAGQDKRITSPGRRMCAYLIDAFIAVVPAIAVSIVTGIIVLPYLLFITYPSPGAGASIFLGYSAFTNISSSSSGGDVIVRSYNYQTGETEEIIEEAYREGVEGQKNMKQKIQPGPLTAGMAIFSLAFYLFYSLVCSLLFRGQTIGKKIMHIRIRCSNASTALNGAILCRELLGKVLINSIPLFPLISLFTVLLTKEHKALHDMLADTVVSDV